MLLTQASLRSFGVEIKLLGPRGVLICLVLRDSKAALIQILGNKSQSFFQNLFKMGKIKVHLAKPEQRVASGQEFLISFVPQTSESGEA